MKIKIKWKVQSAPTGRFSSFQNRRWPTGEIDGNAAVYMSCDLSYSLQRAQDTGDKDIIVRIAD